MRPFYLFAVASFSFGLFGCATGGAAGGADDDAPAETGEAGASGQGGTAIGGKGGAGGKAGSTSAGAGGGTAGSAAAGKGGSSAGAGGSAGKAGAGGGAGKAGSGGVSGTGGTAGKAGSGASSGAGQGGMAAGQGGTMAAGQGGTTAGQGGATAGQGGAVAGQGGGGQGGSTAGQGGGGQGGAAAGQGGGGQGGSPPVDACAVALAKLKVGFETGAEGAIVSGLDGYSVDATEWPYVQWEYGVASKAQKPTGPSACKTGSYCLANDINEDYCQCGRGAAVTPTWNLSACVGRKVSFVFDHWYDFSIIQYQGTTYYDGGFVELSKNGGSSWIAGSAGYSGKIKINGSMGSSYACNSPNDFYVDGKTGFIGDSGGQWVHEVVPVPADFLVSSFAVRFPWSSGVSYQTVNPTTSQKHSSAGWYLDNWGFEVAPQ